MWKFSHLLPFFPPVQLCLECICVVGMVAAMPRCHYSVLLVHLVRNKILCKSGSRLLKYRLSLLHLHVQILSALCGYQRLVRFGKRANQFSRRVNERKRMQKSKWNCAFQQSRVWKLSFRSLCNDSAEWEKCLLIAASFACVCVCVYFFSFISFLHFSFIIFNGCFVRRLTFYCYLMKWVRLLIHLLSSHAQCPRIEHTMTWHCGMTVQDVLMHVHLHLI